MIDVSQATLDVIEAIKKKGVVKFTYKDNGVMRYIKPLSFYGDFEGFEGIDTTKDEENYRRFSFNAVNDWYKFRSTDAIQNKIDKVEEALREAKEVTKEAKGLSYPIVEIMCKLSSIAEFDAALDSDMESMLEYVREAQHNLESAFYDCETVFEEELRTLELELEESTL